jgi:hypothetical protein
LSRFPGVIKLDNGDTLFAEIEENIESNFVTLRLPYEVKIHNEKIQMMQWNPFSDDEAYKVPIHKIVNIATLDQNHMRIYSSFVFAGNAFKIKEQVKKAIATKDAKLKESLKSLFDELMFTTAEIGLRYKVNIPELDQLKDQFYLYVLECYPKEEVMNVN